MQFSFVYEIENENTSASFADMGGFEKKDCIRTAKCFGRWSKNFAKSKYFFSYYLQS